MDYLESGNGSHLVLGSEEAKEMEKESGAGLIALVTQISKALNRRTSEELLGMRLKQFMVLGYVRDRGSVSQQEMEAAGWSVRKRDPHDRRRHLVEITESGKTAVDHAEKARERLEEEILRDLSPEERATLIKLMRRALDGLLRATPEPAKL